MPPTRRADPVRSRPSWLAALGLGALLAGGCRAEPPVETPLTGSSASAKQAQPSAAQVRIGAIDWYVDYDAALTVARAQQQALWVHFGENPG